MEGKVIDFFEKIGEDSKLLERNIYLNHGEYPVLSGQTSNKGIFGYINKYKYEGEFLTWTTYGVKAGTVFYRNGKFSIGRNCAGLKLREEFEGKINLKFIKLILQKKIIDEMGSKDCRGSASIELVQNLDLKIPSIKEQEEYLTIAEKEMKDYQEAVIKKNKLKRRIKSLFASLSLDTAEVLLSQHFNIILGTQFSEKEAYSLIGDIPVYTASLKKPSYYVKEKIVDKIKVEGECLIWARKGNAGKLKLIGDGVKFYITDVSGIIKPKKEFKELYNLNFLEYYLEAIFSKNIRTQDNNPQINKGDIESMYISFPSKDEQDEIMKIISKILDKD